MASREKTAMYGTAAGAAGGAALAGYFTGGMGAGAGAALGGSLGGALGGLFGKEDIPQMDMTPLIARSKSLRATGEKGVGLKGSKRMRKYNKGAASQHYALMGKSRNISRVNTQRNIASQQAGRTVQEGFNAAEIDRKEMAAANAQADKIDAMIATGNFQNQGQINEAANRKYDNIMNVAQAGANAASSYQDRKDAKTAITDANTREDKHRREDKEHAIKLQEVKESSSGNVFSSLGSGMSADPYNLNDYWKGSSGYE